MKTSTKHLLLSLLFCSGNNIGWGLAVFFLNWRAYLDGNREQPIAISVFFAGLGTIIAALIFVAVWPQWPFEWINRRSAKWAVMAGVFYAIGTYRYIAAANNRVPACILGPVGGLHVLVPPLWYIIYHRECISLKTSIGFALSFLSLLLFSGIFAEKDSYKISFIDYLDFLSVVFGWGIGLILQGEAGLDVSFKQFPQLNGGIGIGYMLGSLIIACAVNASEVTNPSNWIPFGVDQTLALSSTILDGLGIGFFTLSLTYSDDFNLMCALSSLYIVIPAILGIIVLHEKPTWNILCGLALALVGLIVLSLEAKHEITKPCTPQRRSLSSFSINTIRLERTKSCRDKTPVFEYISI